MTPTVHIVGAGLAGLSAAIHVLEGGGRPVLYEGAQQAGGRCRSYHDARLGRVIDNGNHLILSGNTSTARYRRLAGADPSSLVAADEARFPFVDLATGERWEVAINDGPLPWWSALAARRPKGTSLLDMAGGLKLLAAGQATTVAALGGSRAMRARFWEPMALAVVNLPPEKASAKLLRATALEAWRDGRKARPMFAPQGLGAALVDPALGKLEGAGVPVRFGHLLKGLGCEDSQVTALRFARGKPVIIEPGDRVVLALPPERLAPLLPDMLLPQGSSSILNAHFVPEDESLLGGKPPLVGTVGSLTQWIFVKKGLVSLTVSAAGDVEGAEEQEDALLARLWSETCRALEWPDTARFAAGRLVREKRATFLQTPENVAKRPQPATSFRNLFLAGDFTDTGLPATIEGAVRSGERAARLALGR